ncbi:hypothetical protein K501DRAFT_272562 [Backusella circina FSU 941]|nr:hypothetical protein K501DRAFT_272562 [Backusella circina FSU 941]
MSSQSYFTRYDPTFGIPRAGRPRNETNNLACITCRIRHCSNQVLLEHYATKVHINHSHYFEAFQVNCKKFRLIHFQTMYHLYILIGKFDLGKNWKDNNSRQKLLVLIQIENIFLVFRAITEHFLFKGAYGAEAVTYLKSSKMRKFYIAMTRYLLFAKSMSDKVVKNRDTEYTRSLREVRSVEDTIRESEKISQGQNGSVSTSDMV